MKNIIETHKTGDLLEAKLYSPFNIQLKNVLESRFSSETEQLHIDLSECKWIDSEGVIFLYKWQYSGKKLKIINPPPVFFEILDILELREDWELNTVKNHRTNG